MKKIVSIIIMTVFLSQSLLTSYMYAADAAAPEAKGAAQEATAQIDGTQQMIDGFLRTDISTLDALSILQIGAYLYLYDKGVVFDFELEDGSVAMQSINYFLKSYAPNVGFLANDGESEQSFKDKSILWAKNYPNEYTKVYDYIKSIQSEYISTPVVDVVPPKSTDAAQATSPVIDQQNCKVVYDKWMNEYNALIKIPEVPYAKIAYVKEMIAAAEQGKDCTQEVIAKSTRAQVQQYNQEAVAQAKSALNFGAATNLRVIPSNIAPAYCEASDNTLRTELSYIPSDILGDMKRDIEGLLNSEDVQASSIKRSLINGITQEIVNVSSLNAMQSGDPKQTFDNMLQGLAMTADNLVNARGLDVLLNAIKANGDRFNSMFESLEKEFGSIDALIQKGGSDYIWNEETKSFTRQTNKDGTIGLFMPSGDQGEANDIKISLVAAKTKNIQENADWYYQTQDMGDMSLSAFVAQAKKDNFIYGYSLDPKTLGDTLAQSIISYAPDYYAANPNQDPTPFIVEAGGKLKMFQDYNLTAVMPAGRFSDSRGSITYIIGKDGDVVSMIDTYQVPEQVKLGIYKDSKLVAGFDLAIQYDEKAIAQGYGVGFPLSIKAQLYVADYLIALSVNRSLVDNKRTINADISIQGPTLCTFAINARMQYAHDGEQGMPMLEPDNINVIDIQGSIAYDQHKIDISIDDIAGLAQVFWEPDTMSVGDDTDNQSMEQSDIIDQINSFVAVDYSFNNTKLASILADAQVFVNIVYTNQETQPLIEVAEKYIGMIRLDTVMSFIEYMGGDEQYTDQIYGCTDYTADNYNASATAEDGTCTYAGYDSTDPTEQGDFSKLYNNTYYVNDDRIYIGYMYQTQDGKSTYEVYPDTISIEVNSQELGYQSYSFDMVDGYIYSAPFASILSDPSIVSAYIYASYYDGNNTLDSKIYIVGSEEVYNAAPDIAPVYTPYSVQVQSTDYPDIGIAEYVFALYESGTMMQYIEPDATVHRLVGQDCYEQTSTCEKYNDTLYPTYLSSVPTYVIDMDQLRMPDVFESSFSISYKDVYNYEHSSTFGLTSPQK